MELSSEATGEERRFRTLRTWKVDCHEESIGRLDLHFLNPRTAAKRGQEDGESARIRESRADNRGRGVHDGEESSGEERLLINEFRG